MNSKYITFELDSLENAVLLGIFHTVRAPVWIFLCLKQKTERPKSKLFIYISTTPGYDIIIEAKIQGEVLNILYFVGKSPWKHGLNQQVKPSNRFWTLYNCIVTHRVNNREYRSQLSHCIQNLTANIEVWCHSVMCTHQLPMMPHEVSPQCVWCIHTQKQYLCQCINALWFYILTDT